MILKEGAKFCGVLLLTKKLWNWESMKQSIFLSYTLLMVFLDLLFDISRMGGAIYETAGRPTGYIKGPCLSYDTTTQKLYTTPHNSGCANYADRFIETSAAVIILSIFVAAMHFLGIWIRERADQTEKPKSTRQEKQKFIKRGTTFCTGSRC